MHIKQVSELEVDETILTLQHGITWAETVKGWRVSASTLTGTGPILLRTIASPYYLGMTNPDRVVPRVRLYDYSARVTVLDESDYHAPTACQQDPCDLPTPVSELCGLDAEARARGVTVECIASVLEGCGIDYRVGGSI